MKLMDYQKLFDLTGKVVIITGTNGLLGSENAYCLKQFGATVVCAIRKAEERWNADKEKKGDCYMECDITNTDSVRECFRKVYEKYGHIDVLVNCANNGGSWGDCKSMEIEDLSDETFLNGLAGSALATFRNIREVTPYMKKNGGGSIINYGSMYGVVAPDQRIYDGPRRNGKQCPHYGAGKAGIGQLTRYCASELGPYNIRVNIVVPGTFPGDAAKAMEGFTDRLSYKTMRGKYGEPYEMCGAVLLLASDASSFMTGSTITVDGGWTAW